MFMYDGDGDTKPQAWKRACDRLGITEPYAGKCVKGHGLDYAGQPCDICAKMPTFDLIDDKHGVR
jgi:hypothetical protein